MEIVHSRCAGLDVSKRDVKVCVRIAAAGRRGTVATVTTWGAVTNQVLALRGHLVAEEASPVVMEATGVPHRSMSETPDLTARTPSRTAWGSPAPDAPG